MKKFAIEIKWGIIFTIVSLVWMFIEKALGWHDEKIAQHAIYTNIFGIVAVLLYVLALLDKRKNFYKDQMNWSQGFVSGVIISIVVAILSPLAMFITHEFITPDYFDNAITHSIEIGNKREDAEAYFNLNSYMLQAFFFSLTVGIVTSAVVALFVRKK
ncbi:DUF4199 domain-containing protein [Gramella sp. GC03-9]|uniref:DUF4199 domain-containing protein n=1 Tax=Christiangramia oceanisediminis TaxID=2920386 RepID=A0A9X2KVE2_9FLAO|nr:DUF4199 domain-containing protein [Gramella oceanisediminis]MCP9198343.1 DUF4199 domain-containing protein [Gramella oceanisediminis]